MGYDRFKLQCNVLDKYLESAGPDLKKNARWSERSWLLGRRRSDLPDLDILSFIVWETGDWSYEELDEEGKHHAFSERISADSIPEVLARNTDIRLTYEERELFTLRKMPSLFVNDEHAVEKIEGLLYAYGLIDSTGSAHFPIIVNKEGEDAVLWLHMEFTKAGKKAYMLTSDFAQPIQFVLPSEGTPREIAEFIVERIEKSTFKVK